MLQKFENQRGRDLVGRICHTDVEEWKLDFYRVTADQVKLILVAHYVHTFGDFGDHARVHLHCDNLLASLEQCRSQVTRSRPDFENYVCWLDSSLVNDLLHDERVFEDVLTERFVKGKVVVFVGVAAHNLPLGIRFPFHHF